MYFQNSCDQDYEFEEWKGIKWFEECAEKWKVASLEEVNRAHTETYQSSIDEEDDLEYYRRWSCYNEIWKRFEYTLFNDSQIVYLQLFAYWDIMDCIRFTNIVVQKVQQWVEDIRKKENLKTVNNKQLDLEDLRMEQQEQM